MHRLAAWAATLKRSIYADLADGRAPSQGEWNEPLRVQAAAKARPLVGQTRFEPGAVVLEFIYPDPAGGTLVLPVRVASPERIVALPVPAWVVEEVWQGEVHGSHEFESDARAMVASFVADLEPEPNATFFGRQAPKRRE